MSIIAIALAVVVFVWANNQSRKEQSLHPMPTPPAAEATASPAASPAPTVSTAEKAEPLPLSTVAAKPAVTIPEEKKTVGTPFVDYAFTNLGGGISSLTLLKHQGGQPGEKMVLNSAATHPIGALLLKPDALDADGYAVTVEGDRVICEKTVPPGVQVRKTYTLGSKKGEEYRVALEVAFTNRTEAPVEHPGYYLFVGAAAPIHSADLPIYIGFDWYDGKSNAFIMPNWFTPSKIPLVGVETAPGKSAYVESPGNVVWAGVRDQYFTTMLLPVGGVAKGVWARPLEVKMDSKELKGMEGFLEMPGFKLNAGESVTKRFTIYAGPAEYRQLGALGSGAVEMMNLDRWWITRNVGAILLRSMNWLQGFFHSYALAIVVLTFIVRGALWPIQGRANQSMKKMQLLQPKMKELQEKYKDDPAKMNQEVMQLYKDYGANPLSGCLPMLIQIPIFIGFYSMLGTAVELRNQGFWWVHDLSRPDTLFHFAGVPVNILPLAMAGTMIWQMQLTPKAGDPAQQKMMMFMPLIFVFVTYNFASALALYYTVQNILSIIQLYATRNQPMPELVKVGVANKKNRR
ncbi:MAG: membrane protein insertase YidC [Verrucomicrobiota bacterium]